MLNDVELRSILTSWGVITLEFSTDGLIRCALPRLKGIPREVFAVLEAGTDLYSCYIRDLFAGKDPRVPAIGKLKGTPFQLQVWQGMLKIRKGETQSYRELANVIGCERSIRAVANACGRNPAPLFVPCHRVIRSDGNLGGFSSGLAWKRLLLAVEQSTH